MILLVNKTTTTINSWRTFGSPAKEEIRETVNAGKLFDGHCLYAAEVVLLIADGAVVARTSRVCQV